MSSSPSTRFDGNDIDGLKEADLKIPDKFLEVGKVRDFKGRISAPRPKQLRLLCLD